MRLFWKYFQRNVLHSIQMPSFTKEFERMFISFSEINEKAAGGVHSKFMHIVVHEFVSSRKYIVSYLVLFASFRFLEG